MDRRIKQLEEDIRNNWARDLDPEVEDWCTDRLAEIRTDKRMLEGKRAFEHFVIDHISDEKEKLNDNERDEPLCTCANHCPLIQGKIPAAVRLEDSFDDGVRRYKQEHIGRPTALIEAYREWEATIARVETELERIKTAMIADRIPGSSQAGDDEPESEESDTVSREAIADD